MFASGSHLAVSASVHLSPELMGTLSATAFRSRGKMPSFWDTGRWLSVLPHIWNHSGLILPIKQGSAGVHPAGGWIPQPSDVLTPTGRLWAGCVSSKRCHPEFRGREKCNYIVLHEKWNETDREREGAEREGGRLWEKYKVITSAVTTHWQRWRAFDGGPSVYFCDVKVGNWGSFIHESTSLMLSGWLSCLYCLPQVSIMVKLLLNNFFYSPMSQVYLVAVVEILIFIYSLCSLLLSPALLLFHRRLNQWPLVLFSYTHTPKRVCKAKSATCPMSHRSHSRASSVQH